MNPMSLQELESQRQKLEREVEILLDGVGNEGYAALKKLKEIEGEIQRRRSTSSGASRA